MAHTAATMEKAAEHIAEVNPAFVPIIDEAGLCTIGRNRRNGEPFHDLVASIVAQQLSVRAADTITARLVAHLDGEIAAQRLVATPDDELRAVGLSGSKTRTIKGLAHAVHSGDLDLGPALTKQPDHLIVQELSKLWGIGRWTAEMFLMFTLHRLDVWPVGDLAMRKGWQIIHGESGDIDQRLIDELGGPLTPYRSVAAWYCWRAVEGENSSW